MDALLRSVEALKKSQDENQEATSRKLSLLEADVAAGHDETTERLVKRMRRERKPEFKRKGHERQFQFIEGVKDRIETASSLLAKVKPDNDQQAVHHQSRYEGVGGRYGGHGSPAETYPTRRQVRAWVASGGCIRVRTS